MHRELTYNMFKLNYFHKAKKNKNSTKGCNASQQTLADILPGDRAQVISFDEHMPLSRKTHLMAYGLSPGYWVEVLQQSPVTIIQIEHTELAMERDLAHGILCRN